MLADKERLQLLSAVDLALAGEWQQAHLIAQDSGQPLAHWIHAVLHKIEGDEGNSRYWYRRSERNYEDYADSTIELQAIRQLLDSTE